MRHYETDSPHAAARIIALALLADGGLDQAELEAVSAMRLLGRLGLDDDAFDELVRDYCHDLELSTPHFDAARLHPAGEVVDALLDEIRDPQLRAVLLDAMQQIIAADGIETEREVEFLASALRQWGITAATDPWPRH